MRSTTVKLDEPPDLVDSLAPGGLGWLSEGTSLVASGPYLSIDVDPGAGAGRFESAAVAFRELLESAEISDEVDLPGTGPIAFGSFTFDPYAYGSLLVVPSKIRGSTEGVAWETEIDLGADAEAMVSSRPTTGHDASEHEWVDAVERARAEIAAGTLEKVVLARQVTVSSTVPYDHPALIRQLRRRFPGCFTFGFANLIGASPELLLRRLGDVVDSIPLAGSAPRGADEEEDAAVGRRLWESDKNRREHALTVTSVLERLDPFCAELVAEPEPSLLLLANLQHLSTKVQGRLTAGIDALTLAGELHPTAAVGGVPREAALSFIREAESFERGRYAGPIGWMDRHGDGEWALALRCALVEGASARVFAGAGIVVDSDPIEELDETRLKLQAMLEVLNHSSAARSTET